jgi:hypothetical protein
MRNRARDEAVAFLCATAALMDLLFVVPMFPRGSPAYVVAVAVILPLLVPPHLYLRDDVRGGRK